MTSDYEWLTQAQTRSARVAFVVVPARQRRDRDHDLGELRGLGEVLLEGRTVRVADLRCDAAQRCCGNRTETRIRTQEFQKLETIHARKLDIAQHDVRSPALKQREGCLGTGGGLDPGADRA